MRLALNRLLALCFFLSGAAGLIYELVWSRYLNLIFGSTTYSITVVVATYMAGLGIGSLVFGAIADRAARPARLYGRMELGIAACALASPILVGAIRFVFVGFHRAVGPSAEVGALCKAILAAAALAIPTLLMGGTLPVLARLFAADGVASGRGVGRLYALNTLGAVIGAAAAGFVTIEHLGLYGSLLLAAALNTTAGLTAMSLPSAASVAASRPLLRTPMRDQLREPRMRVAGALALLAGFAALATEVAWSRALGLIVGSSTWAFSLVLVSYLLGIGLGSLTIARIGAGANPLGRVAAAQLLGGAGGLVVLFGFEALTRFVLHFQQNPLLEFGEILGLKLAVVLVAVLPATLGMGMSFPLTVAVASRGAGREGEDLGLVYAANTAGAILGAALAGFVLLPAIGTHATLRLGIAVHLGGALLALVLSWRARPGGGLARRAGGALAVAALVALLVAARPWPPHLLSAGAYLYGRANLATPLAVDRFLERGREQVLFSREGRSSLVSVWDGDMVRGLRIGGKIDASTGLDMETQAMSGLRSGLAHAAPRDVLVIGAGSGVTARALALHPTVATLDLVEIEPAVIDAGRFFEAVNGGIYRDARVRMVYEDGRNHLLTTTRTYDVVVSEPSNPWMPGTANLFTTEFYGLVRARLRPAGVFCQWVQQYDLDAPTLRRLLATLLGSFREVAAWSTGGADLLVLASQDPLRFIPAQADALFARSGSWQRDLRLIFAEDGEDLLAKLVLDRPGLEDFVADAEPFTDDPPRLEFAALRTQGDRRWRGRLVHELLAARERHPPQLATTAPLPPGFAAYSTGRLLLDWNGPEAALASFEAAAAADPDRGKRWRWVGDAAARAGNRGLAIEAWRRGRTADPAYGMLALRLAEAALGDGDLATASAELRAVPIGERDLPQWLLEASLAARTGDVDTALARLRDVLGRAGAVAEPGRVIDQAISLYTGIAMSGSARRALDELDRAIAAWPRVPALSLAAGDLAERIQAPARALGHYDRALGAGPDLKALAGRARCLAALGRREEAMVALGRGLDAEPWNAELHEIRERLGAPPAR